MNKTIAQASYQEIANAYINKVPLVIWGYRKASLVRDIDDDGVIETYCRFSLKMAERYNLGFEFRIWKSNKDRKRRLKERVQKIISSSRAQFLTLTFNNKFFERETTEETRRLYVSRFLKEQCSQYVANIDYGDERNREHYHALVVPKGERINYAPYTAFFDGSRIYAENVSVSGKSEISISLYISKLTNHALKESGRYKRLIYSRGPKKFEYVNQRFKHE